jgi:2-polyprenyl-3-methyl-5-hydroxy-6-metoxy-1,4-benzoquinol methylase
MFSEKVRYFLWALKNLNNPKRSCPFCKGSDTRLIRRKALVTSLWECQTCGLRFRSPQDRPEEAFAYYQRRYRQELKTAYPGESALAKLLEAKFSNSPLDFREYIEIVKALSLEAGDTLLDFGASWGYGSWQFQQAGFEVYSLEISQPRAAYAREKLHCRVINDLEEIAGKVKGFFSAHVIEHLPDPNLLWQAASRVLGPDGIMVTFCPNGEPIREKICGLKQYHQFWNQKHPLLLNGRCLREMAKSYGFVPYIFSSPYSIEDIRSLKEPSELVGDELLVIARRK